jgi:preprotein translocase subunit SecA
MVSKAIERAQTTVEQRNAETRKNVLKYDEVMNEQRKVIYALRDQVLDKVDLRERIVDEVLPDAVNSLVEAHCVSDYSEEWDLDGLVAEVRTYWPSDLGEGDLGKATSTNELYEMLTDEALGWYEKRETELGPEVMRQVERQIMLQVIDQRWRNHLYEMDYLRGGIGLRAMGQKDPLVEWQREGFDMFGQMMHGIWQDFIRYVMLADVKVDKRPVPTDAVAPAGARAADGTPVDAATPTGPTAADGTPVDAAPAEALLADDPGLRNVQYSSPDDPSVSGGAAAMQAAAGPQAPSAGQAAPVRGNGARAAAPAANTPVVKSEWDKTPRNAPCPCGSGKKYKMCHGRQ